MKYTLERLSDECLQVNIPYCPDNNKFKFLLTADHHWDNPKCDRDLLAKLHRQAIKDEAGIFCFGDLLCVMQGKADPRGSKDDVREEHQSGHYFDKIVTTAADWYEKYKENYIMISQGNHETAVKRHHETDLLQRICDRINVEQMPYSGWIFFRFRQSEHGGGTRTFKLHYNHGYGGGGPVTKGTIQTNRRAVYLPQANMIVTGHVHESWTLETMREKINRNGQTSIEAQTHVQLPTFKEEYLAHEGYHIERGRPPKPLGGYWVEFDLTNRNIDMQVYKAR